MHGRFETVMHACLRRRLSIVSTWMYGRLWKHLCILHGDNPCFPSACRSIPLLPQSGRKDGAVISKILRYSRKMPNKLVIFLLLHCFSSILTMGNSDSLAWPQFVLCLTSTESSPRRLRACPALCLCLCRALAFRSQSKGNLKMSF